MKIPLLDLKQQNARLAPQLEEAFQRVMTSGQFILGQEVEKFEAALSAMLGAGHSIGVSSGTDAILLALMALGIGPGDEVICPSFTFFATAGCISRIGARPVFADSCPVCCNIDVADARSRVTPKTKAIMPVHLFGQSADMDPIMELAREHDLAVIEDAAQALGAEYRGRKAGTIGRFGTFSFFPSKNLGGFGDAGLLVTNDAELAAKAKLLRTHGAKPKYFHKLIGGNFRIDPLQAALLSVKLEHLAHYTSGRIANAGYYTEKLGALEGVAVADQAPPRAARTGVQLLLPATHPGNGHIWNQYTLRVMASNGWQGSTSPRDALKQHLAAREIGCELYYPRPLHQQECFVPVGPHPCLPVSEHLAAECLSIPIYPELAREQQDSVIQAIAGFLTEKA